MSYSKLAYIRKSSILSECPKCKDFVRKQEGRTYFRKELIVEMFYIVNVLI